MLELFRLFQLGKRLIRETLTHVCLFNCLSVLFLTTTGFSGYIPELCMNASKTSGDWISHFLMHSVVLSGGQGAYRMEMRSACCITRIKQMDVKVTGSKTQSCLHGICCPNR